MSSYVSKNSGSTYEKVSFPNLILSLAKEEINEIPVDDTEEEEAEVDLKKEQENILNQALNQAQEILSKAREEANKIKQEAFEKGYIEGTEKGCIDGREKAYEEYKQQMKQSLENFLDDVENSAKDIQHAKERVLEQHLDDLKNISLAIGEKIVQTSLKSSSDIVKNMILSATGKLKKSAWAKIYVSIQDENGARDIQGDADFLSELSRIADNVKITVMEDSPNGTCIIELPQEVIDISVSTQMDNITEILNNARA